MKLYGIKNCDKVRAARQMLIQRGETLQYLDLRDDPPSRAQLEQWLAHFGAALVNKRSTTYRAHKAAVQQAEENGDLVTLLQQYPTLMKRPILETATGFLLGDEVLQFLRE